MGPKPKTSQKTGIARKMAMRVPLVASASGVKGGRGANRAFGMLSGVTASKTGIKVDPLGVAMAVSPLKLGAAAKGLRSVGRLLQAEKLTQRIGINNIGKIAGRLIAKGETVGGKALATAGQDLKRGIGNVGRSPGGLRKGSLVVPKRVKTIGGKISEANFKGWEASKFDRNASTYAKNEARSFAASKAQSKQWLADHAVNPIENRMAVPRKTTVSRGYGTVNQKGLEGMIAGGREPSREMLRIPQILKGTNDAYESIAQKAIKAARQTGLRKVRTSK